MSRPFAMHATTTEAVRSGLLTEAFRLLEGRGMMLDLARELSEGIRQEGLDARIVGGIAVVMHGYVHKTLDIDVHTSEPERLSDLLHRRGATFDGDRGEFRWQGVPIHLALPEQSGGLRHSDFDIDGVRVVDLGDLLSMKLRSGTKSIRHAKDLADVVELIQRNGLGKSFASRLGMDQRPAFRKLVASIEAEGLD